MNNHEEIFVEKQKQGITVVSAAWKPAKGKPDMPEHWDRMNVRLTDGTRHVLSTEFVTNNKLDWGL